MVVKILDTLRNMDFKEEMLLQFVDQLFAYLFAVGGIVSARPKIGEAGH